MRHLERRESPDLYCQVAREPLVNHPRHYHIRSVDPQHLTGKNQVSILDAVDLL